MSCRFAVAVFLGLSVFSGCLKKSSAAKLAELPSGLTIMGTLIGNAGAPVPNAPVYVGVNQTAATQTAADGSFELPLDANSLVVLSGSETTNTLFLYFSNPADPRQQATSPAIDLAQRGTHNLGSIPLQQAATIQGTLLQLAPGKVQTTPAVGVIVSAGHATTTTTTGGAFTLSGVTPGSVTLTATAPLAAPVSQTFTVQPGQTLTLQQPVVLFPLSGVYGIVVPDTTVSIADFVKQGHPFARTFDPIPNASAAFVRFSNDDTQVTASGAGGAAWQPVTPNFDYNFQKDGGSVLYYQFADAGQKTFSPVMSLAVVLDEFADTTGLILGDGSGQLTTNIAPVTVNVPPAAYRMRVAAATADLTSAPWREPESSFTYTFILLRDPSNNQIQGFGNLTLYLQFQDANGMVSPMYHATATLDLFPPQTSSQVFTINNGATVTSTRLVSLSINVPANAYEMLIFEADTTSNVNVLFPAPTDGTTPNTRTIWLTVQPNSYYTFTSVGEKIVYMQFRTVDQAVSPVYKYPIAVVPFANPSLGGFTLNGGAATALSPHLAVDLAIPPDTTSFRIFESSDITVTNGANNTTNVTGTFSADVSTTTPFLTPTPNFLYTAHEAFGVTTVYVQYQNQDNDLSPVYQQTINVLPQPVGTGALIINPDPVSGQSALATTNPTLNLFITPPPGYLAGVMTVYEGSIPDVALTNFVQVPQPNSNGNIPPYLFTVTGVGAHTIFVRFKTTDQVGTITLSPAALATTIFYEPFPQGLEAVAINGGAATVPLATAGATTLTLTAPSNVTQMRLVNDNAALLATQPFQAFAPTAANYALPLVNGEHTVFVQFQNSTGDISTIYSSMILVTP